MSVKLNENVALSELQQVFGKNEPLHKDLADCVVECPVFGSALKHPLVYMMPFIESVMSGSANKALAQKQEMIDKAEKRGDLDSIIWLHERPYRFNALQGYCTKLISDKVDTITGSDSDRVKYINAFINVWTDSENIWQNYDGWVEELGKVRAILKQELAKGRTLLRDVSSEDIMEGVTKFGEGERVTIYRGGDTCFDFLSEIHDPVFPLSWTLDKHRAEWFANRFKDIRPQDGNVLCAEIDAEDIIFYTNARNESEVVIDPFSNSCRMLWHETY